SCRAVFRNDSGQRSSTGSGHRALQIMARHAASGRRAHQRCKEVIVPMYFSRLACAEIRLIGRSTSMRRLQYLFTSNLGLQNLTGLNVIMLDSYDWFPFHPGRVLDYMYFGFRTAVEHDVEPIIIL